MRQTAWLAATPDGSKISRLEQLKRGALGVEANPNVQPAEVVPQETQEIPLPELPEGADYLVSLFYSAGSATQTGMGLVPLSWQEIESWVHCTGMECALTPWELETVRKMSEAYSAEYSMASDPKRRQPYQPVIDTNEVDRNSIDNKIRTVLSMFKKKEAKR